MLYAKRGVIKQHFWGKHTVRILIGIYQNQDEADTFYQDRSVETSAITEVGPFFSKDQALSWMETLLNRLSSCEKAYLPENQSEELSWNGFTCEIQD